MTFWKISPNFNNTTRTFCLDSQTDWDDGVHMLLFVVREACEESLDFSPFELVWTLCERSPKAFKGKWFYGNTCISIADCVWGFKYKLTRACAIAQEQLKQSQAKMKQWYDKDAMII